MAEDRIQTIDKVQRHKVVARGWWNAINNSENGQNIIGRCGRVEWRLDRVYTGPLKG